MTVRGFKLMRRNRDGSLHPLFINKRQTIPVGEWLEAEAHPTNGYAVRPGWHAVPTPHAPHLTTKGRVWVEVTLRDATEYPRPGNQGGTWLLGKAMRVERVLEG